MSEFPERPTSPSEYSSDRHAPGGAPSDDGYPSISSYPDIGLAATRSTGWKTNRSPSSADAARRPNLGRVKDGKMSSLIVISAAAIAVLGIVIGTLTYAFGRSEDTPSSSPRSTQTQFPGDKESMPASVGSDISACSTSPTLAVQSVTESDSGLVVDVRISAACTTGDRLSDAAWLVTVTDGDRDVAAGEFDLEADPIVIQSGSTTSRTLIFPPGMYWQTPELLSRTVEAVGRPSRLDSAPYRASSPGSATLTAFAAGAPQLGTIETASDRGLRDLAEADREDVTRALENRWVPQISSKKIGLFAEGISWTTTDILREHLELRQRYPDVRLVWSGDWTTFSGPSWWVTIVGSPQATAESANAWCDRESLDADHCFAKIVSSTMGTEGTTVLRK